MAWFDDTDALVIAKDLLSDLRKVTPIKTCGVNLCQDGIDWAECRLERLVALLEQESLMCTCATRSRGRSVDALLDL